MTMLTFSLPAQIADKLRVAANRAKKPLPDYIAELVKSALENEHKIKKEE